MKRACLQCGKPVKVTNKHAQFCWLLTTCDRDGEPDEAWLCSAKCAKQYNGDEEEKDAKGGSRH